MSIADMLDMESVLYEVTETFQDEMKQLFEEEPEIFEGHSDKSSWNTQVNAASEDLRKALDTLIEKYEVKLHNGEYA
jgi:hypothetical protein